MRRFGDVAVVNVPGGRITVMYLAPDADIPRAVGEYAIVQIMAGHVTYPGREGTWSSGIYGPGDIGPIRCNDDGTRWIAR